MEAGVKLRKSPDQMVHGFKKMYDEYRKNKKSDGATSVYSFMQKPAFPSLSASPSVELWAEGCRGRAEATVSSRQANSLCVAFVG